MWLLLMKRSRYDFYNIICISSMSRGRMYNLDMIYLTAIGLTPGGISAVHIYTQTVHEQHNGHKTIHRTTPLNMNNYKKT